MKKKDDVKPQCEEHLEQIPFRLRAIIESKKKMNMGSSKLKKITRGMDYRTSLLDLFPLFFLDHCYFWCIYSYVHFCIIYIYSLTNSLT